jgi:hypothetical protein
MSDEMTMFLWWYLIPLLLTVIASPKHIAMEHVGSRCFYKSRLRWNHIILSTMIGVIPIINIVAALLGIGAWIMLVVDMVWDTECLNKEVFKTKKPK